MINQRIEMNHYTPHAIRNHYPQSGRAFSWLCWLGAFAWLFEGNFAQPSSDEDLFYGLVKTNVRLENRIMQTATCLVTFDNSTDLKTWPCHAGSIKDFLARHIFCDRLILETGETLPLMEDSYAQAITTFLHSDGNPNSWVIGGEPLLTAVARADDVSSIQLLLNAGANLQALDLRWERTALLATAETGAVAAANTLLAAGANMYDSNLLGWNLADMAAYAGKTDFIDQLRLAGNLTQSITPHMPDARTIFFGQETQVFVEAATRFTREGLFQEVDAFLAQTPYPRLAASFWLNDAVSARRPDFIRYLFEKYHANPHLILHNRGPAILLALSKNHLREAAVLAEYGALEHLDSAQRSLAEETIAHYLKPTQTMDAQYASHQWIGLAVLGFFILSIASLFLGHL